MFNMISADGFFEGPGKEIDWHNVDAEFNNFAIEQLNNASVLIFGRKTYELMAGYWPSVEALKDDPVVAGIMNSIDKIVFSRKLRTADWNNTRIGKNIEEVGRELKMKNEKDIFIFGSADLASSFTKLKLIDEYRIIISPLLLGKGNPLFKPLNDRLKLKLIRTTIFSSGNVLLIYRPL